MNRNSIHLFKERIILFLSDNSIVFVLLLIYIFFYNHWEKIISEHVVKPLLSHFESNLLSDGIFYTIVLSYLIIFSFYRQKFFKIRVYTISILAILFWVYYRFISHSFEFIALSSFHSIKYVDLVPFFSILIFVPLFVANKKHFSFDEGYIRDYPIDSQDDDVINRANLLLEPVSTMMETDTSTSSFTYGIDASWGSGKTSFMNMMKVLIRSNYSNTIIMDFNPWLYASGTDLITAFIEELSRNLKHYDQSLAKNLIDYSKLLSAFDTEESKLIASLINLTHQDSSLQEKKKRISSSIKRIKKQIFVFIDDLDRLDDDELLEMLKLIRNISDFPYMYFIAAYDKAYLVQCLEKRMNTKGTSFIEKIFQHEFHLPPIPQTTLLKLLLLYIHELNSIGYDSLKTLSASILDTNEDNPFAVLSNLREVKRLANHFSSSYPHLIIEGDIIITDLLLFELLKTKYPLVFTFFERNKDKILELNDEQTYYSLYVGKNDKKHINFLEYISMHNSDFNIDDLDQRTIETIFNRLFNHEYLDGLEGQNNKMFFNEKEWFNRYIQLTGLSNNIPEVEFRIEIRKKEFDSIREKIDEWLSNKQYSSLYHHLLNYKAKNALEQRNLIHSVFYLYFQKEDKYFIEMEEINEAILKLRSFNYNKKFTSEDKRFIIAVFDEYKEAKGMGEYRRYIKENKSLGGKIKCLINE